MVGMDCFRKVKSELQAMSHHKYHSPDSGLLQVGLEDVVTAILM